MPVDRNRTIQWAGTRRQPERGHDAQEVVDVLHLLERLPGQEARGVDVGGVVQPVADLDAGHLAVEELVEHPAQELAIALRIELGAAEVERHLLAGEQHGAKLPQRPAGGSYFCSTLVSTSIAPRRSSSSSGW
jgi:hypothetical protein